MSYSEFEQSSEVADEIVRLSLAICRARVLSDSGLILFNETLAEPQAAALKSHFTLDATVQGIVSTYYAFICGTIFILKISHISVSFAAAEFNSLGVLISIANRYVGRAIYAARVYEDTRANLGTTLSVLKLF